MRSVLYRSRSRLQGQGRERCGQVPTGPDADCGVGATLSADQAPPSDPHEFLRSRVLALQRRERSDAQKADTLAKGLTARRSSENGTQASLPRARAPFPTHSLQPLVSCRGGRATQAGHTCWWSRWVPGQERKRHGAGSHSAASHAQCLGHRAEGREGSYVSASLSSAGPRGSWL